MVNTMNNADWVTIKKVEDRSFSDSHYVTEFVSPQTGIKYYASVANLETAIYKDGEPLRKPELMIFAQKCILSVTMEKRTFRLSAQEAIIYSVSTSEP